MTPENKDEKPAAETALDDDFGNEPLGERQEEACNMEDGCQSCQ